VPQHYAEAYMESAKRAERHPRYNLFMNFKQHKLVISLADFGTLTTHFFLSPGLLLKYFQRKKSLKKNKSMRLLMMRFLRKLLILVKLPIIHIAVRGVPLFLDLLLAMVLKPIAHPFLNPFTGATIDEVQDRKARLNFSDVTFTKNKPYGYQKDRKKGRVKRKIRRRLVRLTSVIDEA
jgi:hypothetical protein